MEFNEQKVDINDLVISAGNLAAALDGIEAFLFHRFGDANVNLKDISALNGLIASVKSLSEEHYQNVESFDGGQ
ncbi:hypothetical protein [Vagococcus xieshaowenii]|uniref:Uncharacterized protein n=1 Tax=Vagococcus xieshaowenii TaxID=2562451 RepID=A0AAJ5JMU7_9ENTE|nr:hypothetical protein [Vagococcus xieshaowenii]QCA28897.1 hypothetical protein E4Z98_06025 [Vagococcus xieshaowenii]TFZ43315.1 hypothetical protein E4031_00395 [Vagococcus xieshaowenii]